VVRSFLAYLQRAYIHQTVILLFLTLSNIRININLSDLLTDNYGKTSGTPLYELIVSAPSGAFWVICIGFQWKKSLYKKRFQNLGNTTKGGKSKNHFFELCPYSDPYSDPYSLFHVAEGDK